MGRTRIIAAVLVVLGTLVGLSPAAEAVPIAPDEDHCLTVPGEGDQLCLHLNQFLGWWTGFSSRYHRNDRASGWMDVQLRWTTSRGASGWAPAIDRSYHLNPGENGPGDSWADLPSFACVTVGALIYPTGAPSRWTSSVTVCRDN
ncbi:hypothetical protein [Amycolatopsis sp. NPDC021455]|uniref:hypothetical protein n=1 Tax=Amycolatopsis sp. NPDC021455 TaxID=3154901 RepID=UPI003411CF04